MCELCQLALMRAAPKGLRSQRSKEDVGEINYPGLLEQEKMQSERGGRARGRHHISNTIPTERLLEHASKSASQSKTILKRSLST